LRWGRGIRGFFSSGVAEAGEQPGDGVGSWVVAHGEKRWLGRPTQTGKASSQPNTHNKPCFFALACRDAINAAEEAERNFFGL
jgi:hypothetical protein